jgi:hypothetical protein
MIAPKFGPTLRMGVGCTAGAMADGGPAAEGGPAAAKRQKTAGGKVPPVSLNLDGARRRTNRPRLATAKAAAGAKGPEVIPLDNDDKFSDEGTLSTTLGPCKVGHTTPRKATKPFVEAPSAEARDFAVKGAPPPAPLTMDDNNAYVGDAALNRVSKPRSTAVAAMRATAVANDILVSGRVVASLRTGKAAELFVKAPSTKARDFAVKGVPTLAPLTMYDDDVYVGDVASNVVSKPRLTAAAETRATAVANNVLISGQVATSLHTK